MSTSFDFEDSLIDWTSPMDEQNMNMNMSRPLIPLPPSTSPLSDDFGDNPFDALERQINDEVLDFWNVSSQSSSCDQNSGPSSDIPLQSEVLIQLDDGNLNESHIELHLLNVQDSQKDECIRDMAMDHSLIRSDRGPENNTSTVFRTPIHSIFWSSDDLSPLLTLDKKDAFNECFLQSDHSSERSCTEKREQSRSMESSWNSLLNMKEDIMSITMPTWCDELSSSEDENNDTHQFHRSLPIQVRHNSEDHELGSEKISRQILKENRNIDLHKSPPTWVRANANIGVEPPLLRSTLINAVVPMVNLKSRREQREQEKSLVSEKLEAKKCSSSVKTTSAKKIESKRTSLSKQKRPPLATSTPHCRKDISEKQETRINQCVGSRRSLMKKETISTPPSPDSTSGLRSNHRHKISSKNRVTRIDKTRRNSLSNSKVSSSEIFTIKKRY